MVRRPTLAASRFVTLASTTEYPMEWFELTLGDCGASLTVLGNTVPFYVLTPLTKSLMQFTEAVSIAA